MSTDGVMICVDPAFPNTCLNSFAGWLLKGMLLKVDTIENDVPCCLFFVEDEEEGVAEIDEDFLRYFAATSDDDPLKRMLVMGNDNLQTAGVSVGDEIFTSTFVDLNEVLRRIIADSEGLVSCAEVTVLCTSRNVRPGNIGSYCSFITADTITSLASDSWFAQQRERLSETQL